MYFVCLCARKFYYLLLCPICCFTVSVLKRTLLKSNLQVPDWLLKRLPLFKLWKKMCIRDSHYVVDYFKRIEFQHRSSPHCHMLLWLNNAPTCKNITDNDILSAITSLIDQISTVDSSKLKSEQNLQTHCFFPNINSVVNQQTNYPSCL